MKTHIYNLSGLHLRLNILKSTGVGLLQLVKVSKVHPDVFVVYYYLSTCLCTTFLSSGGSLGTPLASLSHTLITFSLHILLWDSATTISTLYNIYTHTPWHTHIYTYTYTHTHTEMSEGKESHTLNLERESFREVICSNLLLLQMSKARFLLPCLRS